MHSTRSSENENQSSHIEIAALHNDQTKDGVIKYTSSTTVAQPTASSISGTQVGLDWALIELSQLNMSNGRKNAGKKLPETIVPPQRVVPSLKVEGDVVIVTGYSGTLRGKISSSTTVMRLSQRSKFQEVWSVRLDSRLSKFQYLPLYNFF